MSAVIPIGSRVVLVEDHRAGKLLGRKGESGVVTDDKAHYETIKSYGRYHIQFSDVAGDIGWVNASAVALESPAPEPLDTDALADAIELARLLDHCETDPGSHAQVNWMPGAGLVSDWLRAEVQRELWMAR